MRQLNSFGDINLLGSEFSQLVPVDLEVWVHHPEGMVILVHDDLQLVGMPWQLILTIDKPVVLAD